MDFRNGAVRQFYRPPSTTTPLAYLEVHTMWARHGARANTEAWQRILIGVENDVNSFSVTHTHVQAQRQADRQTDRRPTHRNSPMHVHIPPTATHRGFEQGARNHYEKFEQFMAKNGTRFAAADNVTLARTRTPHSTVLTTREDASTRRN